MIALTPVSVSAGWFGPSDYDECILQSMKGIQTPLAAKFVHESCLKKFPKEKPSKSEKMPLESQIQLTGNAGITPSGYFSGNIYNGNSDWNVTELIINIIEKDKPNPIVRKYKIEKTIPPYTNESISV